ncbi:hypothetical protein RY27_28690 [Litorilinea aerophila]|nr:hypothetical protein RY27_28690 [Litorilinea aerophila]
MVTGPVEATALDTCVVQGIAAGHLANVAEGRSAIAASVAQERFEPGPVAGWEEAFGRFLQLAEGA